MEIMCFIFYITEFRLPRQFVEQSMNQMLFFVFFFVLFCFFVCDSCRKLKLQKSSPAMLLSFHHKGKIFPQNPHPLVHSQLYSSDISLLRTVSHGWASQCFSFSNPLVGNRLNRRALGLTFRSQTNIFPIIVCSSSTVNRSCFTTLVSDFGSHQSSGPTTLLPPS